MNISEKPVPSDDFGRAIPSYQSANPSIKNSHQSIRRAVSISGNSKEKLGTEFNLYLKTEAALTPLPQDISHLPKCKVVHTGVTLQVL